MIRRLAALATVLLPVAAAHAATRFVITGAGNGHGVGMSQWGAYGYARAGWSSGQILAHYYPGGGLPRTGGGSVRVLLQTGTRIEAAARVRDAHGHTRDLTYVATPRGAGFDLRDGHGQLLGTYTTPVAISSVTGTVTLGGGYRGQIEIDRDPAGGLDAINVVPLEDYVAGVVPAEMLASWPAAALEAQAVAARTYALATDAGGALFQQYADTRSQEYKGIAGEAASATRAARATAGQVLVHGGRLATTYFFDSSGGQTEAVQWSFYGSRPQPYLVSVADPWDRLSPYHRWQLTPDRTTLTRELGKLCRGSFQSLRVLSRGVSPRVVRAQVVCSGRTTTATGMQLKAALGLHDTWFTLTRIDSYPATPSSAPTLVERLVTPQRALAGSFAPAPPGGRLLVERRAGGRFVAAARAVVAPGGSFTVALARPGVYRVRAGALAGPSVRVR